jgi:hypothetical protein
VTSAIHQIGGGLYEFWRGESAEASAKRLIKREFLPILTRRLIPAPAAFGSFYVIGNPEPEAAPASP